MRLTGARGTTVLEVRLLVRETESLILSVLCLCITRPGRQPKTFRFRKFWRSYLDQNFLRITNPVSDLTGDQYFYVIFRSCDSGNHHTIFKICMGDSPHTTHHTNPGKNQHPPFFSKMRTLFSISHTNLKFV